MNKSRTIESLFPPKFWHHLDPENQAKLANLFDMEYMPLVLKNMDLSLLKSLKLASLRVGMIFNGQRAIENSKMMIDDGLTEAQFRSLSEGFLICLSNMQKYKDEILFRILKIKE